MAKRPKRPQVTRATHESPVRAVLPSFNAVGHADGRCTSCDEIVPQGEHLVVRCGPGEVELSERCDGPYLTGLDAL